MVFTKRRLFLWGALIALVWVVFNSITPAGSDPLGAQTSAFAMRGKNLFSLLKERGLFDGAVDVTQFKDSGTLLSKIIGEGSEDRRLAFDSFGCVWNVALHVDQVADTNFPVLISANLNPATLGLNETSISLGLHTGAPRTLFDDRALVLVRKNGSAQVIKMNGLSCASILPSGDNALPKQIEYLTPTGKCTIAFSSLTTVAFSVGRSRAVLSDKIQKVADRCVELDPATKEWVPYMVKGKARSVGSEGFNADDFDDGIQSVSMDWMKIEIQCDDGSLKTNDYVVSYQAVSDEGLVVSNFNSKAVSAVFELMNLAEKKFGVENSH